MLRRTCRVHVQACFAHCSNQEPAAAPDICCSTLVRYWVSPGSEVTIIVRPYCRCCWKDSGG